MRELIFGWVLLMAATAFAEPSKEFVQARGEAAEKMSLKDYKGARAALSRALQSAKDDFDRRDVYRMLEGVASQTGDVPAMTEAFEFNLARTTVRKVRTKKLKDYVGFLRRHKALDEAVAKSREKLQDNPDDIVALGVVAESLEGQRPPAPEAIEFRKRFDATNLKVAEQQAKDAESLAMRMMPENSAVGYASAAQQWADAKNPEQVVLMVKKAEEAPALKDLFLQELMHENLGDSLCLIGQFEQGIKHYEAAIKADEAELQKNRLQEKINLARKGKTPL